MTTEPALVHSLVTAWSDMWVLKPPLIEKIARPVIVYTVLILLFRVFGKRELAQLNPFDLVVLLSVSNTVQNAIIGDDNSLIGGLIGAVALFGTNYAMVRFLFRHPHLDELVEGTPTILIRNGQVDQAALKRELLSEAELLGVAHRQGFETLDEIESCVLEPGGVFYMKPRVPTIETQRHEQVMARLSQIEQKLNLLENRG